MLSELDITELRFRKAITVAMLFEISDQDTESKASRLAERMAATLNDLPAKVTVPRRTAELRVIGLEDSVTQEEVATAAPTWSVWKPYATLLGALGRYGYAVR